jgi:H+-translocating NAD(P) transhydrogenase subunit alpha
MVRIAVPRETGSGEMRVALVPESISRLVRAGVEVVVERGAGATAFLDDAAYEKAGARLADAGELLEGATVVTRVRRPTDEELAAIPPGALLVALLQPAADDPSLARLGERGVTALALERVPRITRAQSMDVLSSQATVAGYKAVLLGAAELDKFLPMLTTAAGAIAPARVFVIGAGVAGLQAIATARRLGAVVSGFDIRAAAAEQVQSLGATFVATELASGDAETAGGYAKQQSEDEQERTLRAIAGHIREMDLVVTTAQIPGRPAPLLITQEMVATMRPGSVIVDLAADTGGNCELTRPGETVEVGGVRILAPANLAATLPLHASQMFSRNVLTLLQHLIRDGELHLDLDDDIAGPMCVARPATAAAPPAAAEPSVPPDKAEAAPTPVTQPSPVVDPRPTG